MPIRVVVADDNDELLRLVRRVLDAEESIEVVATASSWPDVVEAASRLQPEVVVVDLSMPGDGDVEVLRAASPAARVVVLTGWDRAVPGADVRLGKGSGLDLLVHHVVVLGGACSREDRGQRG